MSGAGSWTKWPTPPRMPPAKRGLSADAVAAIREAIEGGKEEA